MVPEGTSWGQPRTSREGMTRGHPRIYLGMLGTLWHLMAVPDICVSFIVLQDSRKGGVKPWEVGTVIKVGCIHKASSYNYWANSFLHQCYWQLRAQELLWDLAMSWRLQLQWNYLLQLDSVLPEDDHAVLMYMYHFKSWLSISDFVSKLLRKLEGVLGFHMWYDATMIQNSINTMSASEFGNQKIKNWASSVIPPPSTSHSISFRKLWDKIWNEKVHC